MKPKVLISQITAELPRYYEYYDSLDHLVIPEGTDKLSIHTSSPAKNRNIIIKRALEDSTYTHVFFTDDDHVYKPNTLIQLLERDVDIVSGLYVLKCYPFPPLVLDKPKQNKMSKFIDMNKIKNPGLVKVGRVPAGCLLVRTYALRMMQDYDKYSSQFKNMWFTIGQITADEWGDDSWFCDRARDCGLDIHIDTHCPVGHITKCVLYPRWDGESWQIDFKINEDIRLTEEINTTKETK